MGSRQELKLSTIDHEPDHINAKVARVNELLKLDSRVKRAVIYARTSSDNQDVANSIDAQVAQAKDFIQRQGWILVAIYTDDAQTGRTSDRPQFLDMISDGTRNREFDIVVVWKLNRFARHKYDSIVFKNRLSKAKIQVISINEPNDGSPQAMFMEGIVESMDEYYSANLSQDVRRGTRRLAERGFFVGSEPAYGYRIVDVMDGERSRHKLDLDPLTAPIARRIWEMALDRLSPKKIMRTLNKDGIPSPKGGKWPVGTIYSMLKNEHYLGIIVRGLQSSHTDEPIRMPNSHPAIVSQEEFDRVQTILAERAPQLSNPRAVHPRQIGSKHLFSEVSWCGNCGQKATHRWGKSGKYTYIQCKDYSQQDPGGCTCPPRNVKDVEPKIMNALMEDILTEPNIQNLIDHIKSETDKTQAGHQQDTNALHQQLEEVIKRQNRVELGYETGRMSLEKYVERMDELNEQQANLEALKAEAQVSVGNEAAILENPAAVLSYAEQIRDFLKTADPSESKPLIKKFVKRVLFGDEGLTIEYRLPLPEGGPFSGLRHRRLDLGKKVPSIDNPSQQRQHS